MIDSSQLSSQSNFDNTSTGEFVFSVAELNQQVRNLLEGEFPSILVCGEISNLSKPASGHWYFSLKDEHAQIRAAMFRNRNQLSSYKPENGMTVIARAKLSLYAPRGDYQLIVENLQAAGEGALKQAFEQLKTKLQQAGLFEEKRKKQLPTWPQAIAVVTSATGAALRDILHVLSRRCPSLHVYIFPTAVQGEEAAAQIVRALTQADQHSLSEVIILARGGGSLEDLWSFNEESVAQAICNCQTPIVCGVGHQTDFTISDFVADIRAPTPSAAAEIVSPDQTQMLAAIQGFQNRLLQQIQWILQEHQQTLALLCAKLIHPRQKIEDTQQTLDRLQLRMQHAYTELITQKKLILKTILSQLLTHNPGHRINQLKLQLDALGKRLTRIAKDTLYNRYRRLEHIQTQLHLVSPLATLGRGYSLTFNTQKKIIKSTSEVKIGDTITTILKEGSLTCEIKESLDTLS